MPVVGTVREVVDQVVEGTGGHNFPEQNQHFALVDVLERQVLAIAVGGPTHLINFGNVGDWVDWCSWEAVGGDGDGIRPSLQSTVACGRSELRQILSLSTWDCP